MQPNYFKVIRSVIVPKHWDFLHFMNRIFNKNFSFFTLALIIVLISFGTFLVTRYLDSEKIKEAEASLIKNEGIDCKEYKIKRLKGYKYIKPLMFVDNDCQSKKLEPIKNEVNALFESYKSNGVLNSAALYLKDYSTNDWIAINENEDYSPGSLLKVPTLITILKMSESHPELLNKKIPFNKNYNVPVNPQYLSKSITFGQYYSVKELLVYMIKYSDNNATILLNEITDVRIFKKLFTDFGFKEIDMTANDYPMTVVNYSYFLNALYNASYLNIDNSEFAVQLLSKSDFKEGILKGIPTDVDVAEKFGESGDVNVKELHETAIIYLNERPYLLTIMTKGKEINNLPEVIKQASAIIYNQMHSLKPL